MKEIALQSGLPLLAEPWWTEILVIVALIVVVNFGVRHLLRRAGKATRKTANLWDDAIIGAAIEPVRFLIWLIGIVAALDVVGRHVSHPFFDYVPPLRTIGVVACLAWFLIRLIGQLTDNIVALREASGGVVDRTTVDALSKLAKLTVVVIALLVTLQNLDISIAGILAAGGIGGIAIGFAAKDLLANFFGGLTIYLDRPFAVGEWIRSPDKDIEGTVERISWRHTQIRRFNKNPLYVPNALFTTIVVENPSRMSNRRIKQTIGIRYQDLGKMTGIVTDVKAMLQAHPEIDTSKTLIVNFDEFAEYSLNFFIYTFTRTTEWVRYHEIKQDILLRVADIITGHGAEIAFPTRTVHLENRYDGDHS